MYGIVYLVNGYAFKKLDGPLTKTGKKLCTIKDIEHHNLYKIKACFYDESNTLEHLVAYSMKYYIEDNINILTMPTEYTLDNLSDL